MFIHTLTIGDNRGFLSLKPRERLPRKRPDRLAPLLEAAISRSPGFVRVSSGTFRQRTRGSTGMSLSGSGKTLVR